MISIITLILALLIAQPVKYDARISPKAMIVAHKDCHRNALEAYREMLWLKKHRKKFGTQVKTIK